MPIPVFRREEISQKESEETTIEEKWEEKKPKERVIDGNCWAYSKCLLSVLFPGKTRKMGGGL